MDWNTVVEQIGPPLYRYFSVGFSRGSSADLVQECLIRLVRKCEDGHFDPKKGSLRAYAFGIAQYVRLEAIKAMPPEDPFSDELEATLASPEPDTMPVLLRRAIAQLPETEKRIVLLHIDEEITLAEIAAILQMPVGTVKSHVHRAKANLKNLLQEEGVPHGRT